MEGPRIDATVADDSQLVNDLLDCIATSVRHEELWRSWSAAPR